MNGVSRGSRSRFQLTCCCAISTGKLLELEFKAIGEVALDCTKAGQRKELLRSEI
jgi:hypothetical protein